MQLLSAFSLSHNYPQAMLSPHVTSLAPHSTDHWSGQVNLHRCSCCSFYREAKWTKSTSSMTLQTQECFLWYCFFSSGLPSSNLKLPEQYRFHFFLQEVITRYGASHEDMLSDTQPLKYPRASFLSQAVTLWLYQDYVPLGVRRQYPFWYLPCSPALKCTLIWLLIV